MKKGDLCSGKVISCAFPDKAKVETADGTATVRYALPGQTVSFRVKKKRADHVEGELLEVLEHSPSERTDTCPHFGICGGCFCAALDYDSQLRLKEEQMRGLLRSVDLEDIFTGILGSPVTEGYRNKMELSFGDAAIGGPLELGMHKRRSFYDIVTVDQCQIMTKDMKRAAKCVLDHMRERSISYYHRMRHEGTLRYLLLRQSATNGELLAALVTADGSDADQMELSLLCQKLQELPLDGKLSGFLHMKDNNPADALKCEECTVLYGSELLSETVLGLHFDITPFSFFQTNTKASEVLYSTVRDFVGETKDRTVFDLYSGTGTIAQLLSPVAKHVTGVEIVEEAVEAARENARSNGLENCSFLAGDVLTTLDSLKEKPDLIVLDPPRDGVHPKALPKILAYGVSRIIYVSCKPTSFIRDYPVFAEAGYKAVKATAVDMFPGTAGTELVVCLEKTTETKEK